MAEDKRLETDDLLVLQESDLEKLGDESELNDYKLSYEKSDSTSR